MEKVTLVKDSPLLTYSDLAKLFDAAKNSLQQNSTTDDLIQLATVLHVIGTTKNESFCILTADALGYVGATFTAFFPLIDTPVPLSKEIQDAYSDYYKKAVDETCSEIEKLKKEFCENDEPDWKNVVNSLGIIQGHTAILQGKYNTAIRLNRGITGVPLPPQE